MSAGMSTKEITQKQLKPPEVKSPDRSWPSVFGLILKRGHLRSNFLLTTGLVPSIWWPPRIQGHGKLLPTVKCL